MLKMFNPIALKMAKTPLSFGRSECSRVKLHVFGSLYCLCGSVNAQSLISFFL